MKTVLYWFSGTGNTLAAARELAGCLGETELRPVIGSDAVVPADVKRVGLLFPVYAFGPPICVGEFLQKLQVGGDVYLFAVATMGGIAGSTHHRIRKILASRGLGFAAGWSVRMPGNCISLYPAPGRKSQEKLFTKAREKIAAIAEAIRQGSKGPMEDSFPLLRPLGDIIYKLAIKHFHSEDRHFAVTDECINCDLCRKICPVENIVMAEGRPQWQHRCEQCYACINWCPVSAIEIGKKTVGRERYHHPQVSADQLCLREKK